MPTSDCRHSPTDEAALETWTCPDCGETRHSCAHTCAISDADRYRWLLTRQDRYRVTGRDRPPIEDARGMFTVEGCVVVRYTGKPSGPEEIVCNDCGRFSDRPFDIAALHCSNCRRYHPKAGVLAIEVPSTVAPAR